MRTYPIRIKRTDGQTAIVRGIPDATGATDCDIWMDIMEWSKELYDILETSDILDVEQGQVQRPREGEPIFDAPAEAVAWFTGAARWRPPSLPSA